MGSSSKVVLFILTIISGLLIITLAKFPEPDIDRPTLKESLFISPEVPRDYLED